MKDVLIYTVHKAASMFLHRLATELAKEYGIDYYSINQDENFELIKHSSWMSFIQNGNRHGCFGPIRAGEATPNIPDDLEHWSVLLHLRDPRDVLVSLFFSNVYSHPKAGGFNADGSQRKQWETMGIDNFVLDRAPEFLEYYQEFADRLLGNENVIFVKYETMVLDYASWLQQFLKVFSHLPLPSKGLLGNIGLRKRTQEDIYHKLYAKHINDFTTSKEDVNKHKRQIIPGDYKRKLLPETIDELSDQFADILTIFRYQ